MNCISFSPFEVEFILKILSSDIKEIQSYVDFLKKSWPPIFERQRELNRLKSSFRRLSFRELEKEEQFIQAQERELAQKVNDALSVLSELRALRDKVLTFLENCEVRDVA